MFKFDASNEDPFTIRRVAHSVYVDFIMFNGATASLEAIADLPARCDVLFM